MNEVKARDWLRQALRRLNAERTRCGDTSLLKVGLPLPSGLSLYIKDETGHPTGSLKHRLARSLFEHALCSGHLAEGTLVVEASSGSTAVSEAYFAQLLGLPFMAVVPHGMSPQKVDRIRSYGGQCHFVDSAEQVRPVAAQLAAAHHGIFLDQFENAERVIDWRSHDSIGGSIVSQLQDEEHKKPAWIVCGAGTGGTSSAVGRYARYHGLDTRLCLADPRGSAFHRFLASGDRRPQRFAPTCIEGIGRPCVEPSFIPSLIDKAVVVDDDVSIAAARVLSRHLGKPCGGSTGTNLYASLRVLAEMARRGETGAVVTILCDSGERYRDTYYNDAWLKAQGFDCEPIERRFEQCLENGLAGSDDFLFAADPGAGADSDSCDLRAAAG